MKIYAPDETANIYCGTIRDYPTKEDCKKCRMCRVSPFGQYGIDTENYG